MKIITLNCANYDDHLFWATREKIIVNKIAELKPDIVCLQEVRFDPGKKSTMETHFNMSDQIVSDLYHSYRLNYHDFFQRSQCYDYFYKPVDHITDIYEGMTILIKDDLTLPNFITSSIFLPNGIFSTDKNKRITQHLSVINPQINIFNTHFSYDNTQRNSDIEYTLDWCSKFNNNIIVGDMNGQYSDIQNKFLADDYIDVWNHIYPNQNGYTFPSYLPTERIDFCWVKKNLIDKVKNIEIIFNEPEFNVYASDHYGLLIELLD